MEYNFSAIEKKWQAQWKQDHAYRVSNESSKPKFYVLDMFPYPSGSGLHVGHPLGYIASDIYSRFKRLKGFNVLHPMGYDAFGLPAEQYAIEHGVHPAVSTAENIDTFRKQLDNIGFCFDWDREVRTSDPSYYKWTQWIFLQLFNSYYNRLTQKAEPIAQLVTVFEKEGNIKHVCPGDHAIRFSAMEWNNYTHKQQQDILMNYRLAFCGYGEVNWCEALGTVLANDEVINGVSERGGHPVVKKKLRQWYLRITEYADRLLDGLQTIDFSEAMKEMQTNWIGKSSGAEISFQVEATDGRNGLHLHVYTTRPDTIFGVDFMVVAPEHELIERITSDEQKETVEAYIAYVKSRSERERQAEKKITGAFTGAYALNPFDGRKIPVWISEYVLAGYGTGAIMAVPCGDERDYKFAKHFNIPITNIIGDAYNGEEANATKDAKLENSGFLNGMVMRDAMEVVIDKLEDMGIGKRKVNYKMRDAAFSRQRYWGEPFPIQWKNGVAVALSETELPLELPAVDHYSPGPEGEGPLANIPEWVARELETNTMPGYAGSSWYFLRYMDPHNQNVFCDRKASDYWNQVDLYIGGTEHAVGHLLYSRLWTKVLCDLGYIGFDEPFKKLLNQGMIVGQSYYTFVDFDHKLVYPNHVLTGGLANLKPIRIPYAERFFEGFAKLDIEKKYDFFNAISVPNDFKLVGIDTENKPDNFDENVGFDFEMMIEKMSKSKYNTVNPDDIIDKFGADTFRMYEMFLGPVEQSKPWDTKGIEGVHRFIKKLWRLFFDEQKGKQWDEEKATAAELKVLHRTIKKIEDDTERFSFNTAVSTFMICVNELSDLKSHKREVLESLLIMLTPYAPHIAEELWHQLGNTSSVLDAAYPVYNASFTAESEKEYPVSINGRVRTNISISLDATEAQVKEIVLGNEMVQKWMEDKPLKKLIFVKGKMINVVI